MSQIQRHMVFRAEGISCRHMTTVKESKTREDTPMHTHEVYELILIRSGKGFHVVEGRRYPMHKNALVITRPGKLHRIHIESEEQPYERYILMYEPRRLLPELCDAIPQNLDILYLDSNHIIVNLFQKMNVYCQQLQGAELERLMYALAEVIFFNIRLESGRSGQQRAISGNPVVQRAIAYIEEHIATLSGIGEICDALFITRSHLHHLFADYLQITPKKYILTKRLSLARRAIRTGEKPTKVYLECGFHSYAAFYRDYKQFYGHSPSEESSMPDIPDILT